MSILHFTEYNKQNVLLNCYASVLFKTLFFIQPKSILRQMSDCSPVSILTKWLDQYLNFEHLPQKNIFWLDTMQYLCARFNHPENYCPSFHVAGSKGKGSTSMMIACILQRASSSNTVDSNENIGLYTSPHIIEFIER